MTKIVQNSLSAGELSPNLYGRTDLAKYHSGVMLAKNCYVDYRGGLTSRQGTQLIGKSNLNGKVKLRKWVFSGSQTYMLVFTDQRLEFIKNPLTPAYPNGSNAAFIESAPGVRYFITTPYTANDIGALKFSQSADVMIITHPGFEKRQLSRLAETNWTLTEASVGTTVATPTNLTASITALPAGSTDPQKTNYAYVVTAVVNGEESQPCIEAVVTGINIATTQGTITLQWNWVQNADYYNVYRAISVSGMIGGAQILVSPTASYGFLGTAYGTQFTDSNIIPDFSQTPPTNDNPFANGRVIGFNITAGGATYPVGATTATITDPNGATAFLVPVLSSNVAGGTGSINGFVIKFAGKGITNGASIVVTGAGGAGFVGTVVTAPASGSEPAVSTYFQGRRVYAGSNAHPVTLNASRPGYYSNFDVSNPVLDSDAYEFTLAVQEINRILYMIAMPGGLVLFSDGGVVQLTGGSSNPTNPSAVTPSSAVIVPQSNYGAADVEPIVIDYDILFIQAEGNVVRDLSYNFFVNIYTASDLTLLSTHLFDNYSIVDWAYQAVPNKIIWSVRSDGNLLALAYLKEQEIYGHTLSTTTGAYLSIESVREGTEDAVYMVVNRFGTICIERLAGHRYNTRDDIWCLDSALSTPINFPTVAISVGTGFDTVGASVAVSSGAALFALGDVGKQITCYGVRGKAIITSFVSNILVQATVVTPFEFQTIVSGNWMLLPLVTGMSGLGHLEGQQVWATIDSVKQGPMTVASGAVVFPVSGYQAVVGLKYQCKVQQLPPQATGGPPTEGKLGRPTSMAARVMNAGPSLQYGPSFTELYPFDPVSSTDPVWDTPYQAWGMITGEQRMNVSSQWDTQGGICLQMDDPYPFTVLSFINEEA